MKGYTEYMRFEALVESRTSLDPKSEETMKMQSDLE